MVICSSTETKWGEPKGVNYMWARCLQKLHQNLSQKKRTCQIVQDIWPFWSSCQGTLNSFPAAVPGQAQQVSCGRCGHVSEAWSKVCLKKLANLGTPSSLKGFILSVANWSFWSPFFCGNSRIRSYNGHGQFRWFAIDANMTPSAFSRFMISPES